MSSSSTTTETSKKEILQKSQLIEYKGLTLVQWPDGVDIVDMATGRWRTAKTLRAAKWNVSVWQRLCREFTPKPHPAVA